MNVRPGQKFVLDPPEGFMAMVKTVGGDDLPPPDSQGRAVVHVLVLAGRLTVHGPNFAELLWPGDVARVPIRVLETFWRRIA